LAAILEDLDTGQVLYGLRPDARRAIASTTKIMTAYLALQRERPSRVVTVGPDAASLGAQNVGVSELGLREGEKLSVSQLLYALLLQSSNDAAVALADSVSRTTDRFVTLMNRTAHQVGLTGTRYFSPNGLDDRGYSTARSLATVTRLAERVPTFARIVKTKFRTIPAAPGGEPRTIQNRNVLLWLYPGAVGVKTGYTAKAGFCLVAAASSGGQRLVAVVLGERSDDVSFDDAATLLDYGFHAFIRRSVVTAGQTFRFAVRGTLYAFEAARSLRAWVLASRTGSPRFTLRMPSGEPIDAGRRAGSVRAALGGRILGRVPLVVTARLGPVGPPLPGSEGLPTTPWWARGLGSIDLVASSVYHSVFG
jgi:D-alanyl-D-alanine carboxypeptidase (penicillin-binding protein 5/6)